MSISLVKKEFPFPDITLKLSGISIANFRTGIRVEPLGIVLDSGLHFDTQFKCIFITHTHLDHINNLYSNLLGNEIKPLLIVPKSISKALVETLNKQHQLSVNPDGKKDKRGKTRFFPFNKYKLYKLDTKPIDIKIKTKFRITPFKMDHTVPTLGYGISKITKKLNPEYKGLSQEEYKKLAHNGVNLNIEKIKNYILFCGDTSSLVLDILPFDEYPIVIIESTFLYDEHYKEAAKRKHLHINDLIPFIKANEKTKFVLIHFSARYKNEEILKFFEDLNIENIIPFVQKKEFKRKKEKNYLFFIAIFLIFFYFFCKYLFNIL